VDSYCFKTMGKSVSSQGNGWQNAWIMDVVLRQHYWRLMTKQLAELRTPAFANCLNKQALITRFLLLHCFLYFFLLIYKYINFNSLIPWPCSIAHRGQVLCQLAKISFRGFSFHVSLSIHKLICKSLWQTIKHRAWKLEEIHC